MNARPPLQIKSDRNGFRLVPDPLAPFSDIVAALRLKMLEARAFFLHSKMILDLSRRPFRAGEVETLRTLLRETAEVTLTEVRLGNDLGAFFKWASQKLAVTVTTPRDSQERKGPRTVAAADTDATVRLVHHTCRSGTRIESPGDCVILGDVNPGAEILAAGDIVVFGNLRGVAHAGMLGDRSAKIVALSIEPHQIRIADLVALPPKGKKPEAKRFERAEIRGGRIEVVTL